MKKITCIFIVCLSLFQLSLSVRCDTEVTYVHSNRADERFEYKKRVFFLCATMIGTVAAAHLIEQSVNSLFNYRKVKKLEKAKDEQGKKVQAFLERNAYEVQFNPEKQVTEIIDQFGNPLSVNISKVVPCTAEFINVSNPFNKMTLYTFFNEKGQWVTLHGI